MNSLCITHSKRFIMHAQTYNLMKSDISSQSVLLSYHTRSSGCNLLLNNTSHHRDKADKTYHTHAFIDKIQ